MEAKIYAVSTARLYFEGVLKLILAVALAKLELSGRAESYLRRWCVIHHLRDCSNR
jgi:hypothetical protein